MKVTRLIQIYPNKRGKPDVYKNVFPMSLKSLIEAMRESLALPEHVFQSLLIEGQATFKDLVTNETTTLHVFEFEADVSDHDLNSGKRDEVQREEKKA